MSKLGGGESKSCKLIKFMNRKVSILNQLI